MRFGRTELHYAAVDKDAAEVQRLLDEGADPNVRDSAGMTPLHFACQMGATDAARALLEAGADVDSVDVHGNTPLWKAIFASKGEGELIGLLRDHGADPYLTNRYGKSPVEVARSTGGADVARFFADLPSEVPKGADTRDLPRPEAPVDEGDPVSRSRQEARRIWREYVPAQGQSLTVQGELLRAVEKLRWEAMTNGNQNWDRDFEKLAEYLRATLVGSELFRAEASAEIVKDIQTILDYEHPLADETAFDRLTERVVEWSLAHPEPVPRDLDPTLRR
jgi:uncharacterized protein